MEKQLTREGTLIISKTTTVIITNDNSKSSSTKDRSHIPRIDSSRPFALLIRTNSNMTSSTNSVVQIKRPPWRPAGPLYRPEPFKPIFREPQQRRTVKNSRLPTDNDLINKKISALPSLPAAQQVKTSSGISRKIWANHPDLPAAGIATKLSDTVADCLNWDANSCNNYKPPPPREVRKFY